MFHMPSQISRYEIKTLIGAGGMGSLYLARDTNPNTSRLVVVKLLLANLDSGDLRARFAREARALAALNHPNIVDIYDSGEFQGSPYIVMEYIRGETLAEKIKRRAPMTLAQKMRLMVELCSGLAHAHESNIIHRDIKPANLMVDLHGRLKVLDFGIARVSEKLTRAAVQVTQINMRIGTPGYMSPEQIEGGEIDARSDLFAVGTVCYELIAYREAFTGTNTRQIENRVLQTEPAPLASYMPGLDPEVEGIVRKALSKDPRDRFQSASEMEQAFEQIRWRLGPDTPIAAPPRGTPTPSGANRKTDSRADTAYSRSRAFYSEGAHEAARRFAIEALAEDSEHQDARTLVEQLGHRSWQPLPPRGADLPSSSDPTVLRTEAESIGTLAGDAETVLSSSTHRAQEATRETPITGWQRHSKALQIAGLVLAVIGVAVAAAIAALWITGDDKLTLTIQKPEGGTLVSDNGLRCGTGGNNCSVPVSEGDVVEFQPEADPGYGFTEYKGDCAPFGRIRVRAASECGAVFTKNTVSSAPAETAEAPFVVVPPSGGMIVASGASIMCGKGKEDCAVTVARGTRVSLNWLEDPEYIFKGWTGDCAATNGQAVVQKSTKCGVLLMRRSMSSRTANRGSTPTSGGSGGPPVSADRPPPSSPPATPPGGVPSAPPADPLRDRPIAPPVEDPSPPEPADKPRPVRTPESIAKEDIAELLEAWRKAWEAMDLGGIQRLYPEAPKNYISSLKYQFGGFKEVRYTYTTDSEYVNLNVALGNATVKRNTLFEPVYKSAGTGPQKQEHVFTLKRFDGVWRIAGVASRPAK